MWEELSHYQPPSSEWKEDIEHQHIYNKDNKRQLTFEEKDELVCSHCGKKGIPRKHVGNRLVVCKNLRINKRNYD